MFRRTAMVILCVYLSLSLTKERTLVLSYGKSHIDLFLTDSAGMFVLMNEGDQVLVKG